MRVEQRPVPGSTVFLMPRTLAAPRVCYLGLAVEIVSYRLWPDVEVRIAEVDAEPYVRLIHADNIVLHRPKARKGGDGVAAMVVPKPITRRPGGLPPMKLGPEDEELPLWTVDEG